MEGKKMSKEKHEKKNVETMHEKMKDNAVKENDKASEYLELAQRITAEFENYKKRNADLAKKSEEDGIIKAVEKMLPVVDAFDNAFKMVTEEGSKQGLKLVYDIIIDALKDLGVEEIDALGKEFDPDLHNAVIATDDSENVGKVLEVYQKGFTFAGRVIRYSMVRVAK